MESVSGMSKKTFAAVGKTRWTPQMLTLENQPDGCCSRVHYEKEQQQQKQQQGEPATQTKVRPLSLDV